MKVRSCFGILICTVLRVVSVTTTCVQPANYTFTTGYNDVLIECPYNETFSLNLNRTNRCVCSNNTVVSNFSGKLQCSCTNYTLKIQPVSQNSFCIESTEILKSPNSYLVFHLKFKDCDVQPPLCVRNSSNQFHGKYNSVGQLGCQIENAKLVYKNASVLQNNTTRCQNNAKWSGQENLLCIKVKINVSEAYATQEIINSSLCSTNNSLWPNATSFSLEINGVSCTQCVLQPNHNNQKVLCKLHLRNGENLLSQPKTLNVKYPPQNISLAFNGSTLTSKDMIYTLANETLLFKCASDANPTAKCQFLLVEQNSSLPQIYNMSSCALNVDISGPITITCKAYNDLNCIVSNATSFVTVPKQRVATITSNITGRNVTAVLVAVKGQAINISCGLEYQNELNTTFKWFKYEEVVQNQSILILSQIDETNSGNFTCATNDSFGSFSTSVVLDVQYGPEVCNSTLIRCLLLDVCSLCVTFNPPAYSVILTKKDGLNNGPWNLSKELNSSLNYYNFQFNETYGPGNFTLAVTNQLVTANFSFMVLNKTRSDTSPGGIDQYWWVILILVLLLVIATCIGVYLYCKRQPPKPEKKKGSHKEERQNPLYVTSGDISNGNSGGKEDRVNPLYAGTSSRPDVVEDAYAEVNKKNKSEKEVKVNPIYASSANDGGEAAYATVNQKTKKKKREKAPKEMKENILYKSSEPNQSQIEDAYAEVNKSAKKAKNGEKEERVNPLYGGVSPANQNNSEVYSTVNKPKKK